MTIAGRLKTETAAAHDRRPERRKLAALRADLMALGLTPAAIDALPVRGFAGPPSTGAGLGWLYVLEGATLGGAVIARHLSREQAVPPAALSFHTLYGRQLGVRWRAFHAALARWVGDDRERGDVVVAGALSTFAAFEDWCLG
jgi:heme oxygenase